MKQCHRSVVHLGHDLGQRWWKRPGMVERDCC
jgi:hypothetical protein